MKKEHFSYNPKLKEYSKELRKNPTYAERAIWYSLRENQLKGYDFDRQKPIGEFIYDFFCSELKLVIEIDGATHDLPEVQEKDKAKDEFIRSIGLNILRFTDDEVLGMSDYAVKKIEEYIRKFKKNVL